VDQAIDIVGSEAELPSLLGVGSANLALLAQLNAPIPMGFTVTTEACKEFYKQTPHSFPPGMWEETLGGLHDLEETAGRQFGDAENPLFVSCRADPPVVISGLARRVLNLGLNDEMALGTIAITSNPKFVWNSYRYLIETFSGTVLGIPAAMFGAAFQKALADHGRRDETDLSADELQALVQTYKDIVQKESGSPFPQDPFEQIRHVMAALLHSYGSKAATEYRKINRIPNDIGCAVCITAMAFGNMGDTSATGFFYTHNPTTGDAELTGEFLLNSQVCNSAERPGRPLAELKAAIPAAFDLFANLSNQFEKRLKDALLVGFVVETESVWIVKVKLAKRTAVAAMKIATDLVNNGLLTKGEAILRMESQHVQVMLHSMIEKEENLLVAGLRGSPGAAAGHIVLSIPRAMEIVDQGKDAILVQQGGKIGNVRGMLTAKGFVTIEAGWASSCIAIARQNGLPAVVGCSDMKIDIDKGIVSVGDKQLREGDVITIDGNSGKVFTGKLAIVPRPDQTWVQKILAWSDDARQLKVRANVGSLSDAQRAKDVAAEGIGTLNLAALCTGERRQYVQQVILGDSGVALTKLGEALATDVADFLKAMNGLPVSVQLFDEPLQQFLPDYIELLADVATLKATFEMGQPVEMAELKRKSALLKKLGDFREVNPLLGVRGVRSAIVIPGFLQTQLKAIIEGACIAAERGGNPQCEVLIPRVSHANEIVRVVGIFEKLKAQIFEQRKKTVNIQIGAMIQTPRAAIVAGQIAKHVDFFCFGTNVLTEMGCAYSKDDAEASFMPAYRELEVFPASPFEAIDVTGIGKLIQAAIAAGKEANPRLRIGIVGEQIADLATVQFCHAVGCDYLSCGPFEIPVAKFAAAQATLKNQRR
jgi:pyruvate,orthophosphate dikinase